MKQGMLNPLVQAESLCRKLKDLQEGEYVLTYQKKDYSGLMTLDSCSSKGLFGFHSELCEEEIKELKPSYSFLHFQGNFFPGTLQSAAFLLTLSPGPLYSCFFNSPPSEEEVNNKTAYPPG